MDPFAPGEQHQRRLAGRVEPPPYLPPGGEHGVVGQSSALIVELFQSAGQLSCRLRLAFHQHLQRERSVVQPSGGEGSQLVGDLARRHQRFDTRRGAAARQKPARGSGCPIQPRNQSTTTSSS